MSRKRRGKSKKSRGPRPPKPPGEKAKLAPILRPFASEGPTAAEVEEWNASGEASEGYDWSQEELGSEEIEASLKEWADLDVVEAELANLVGAFVEEFPACGNLDQAQGAFESVCLEEIVERETIRPWAAGLVHHLAASNSALEAVSPEQICGQFEVPLGTSAEWALKVAAALRADTLG